MGLVRLPASARELSSTIEQGDQLNVSGRVTAFGRGWEVVARTAGDVALASSLGQSGPVESTLRRQPGSSEQAAPGGVAAAPTLENAAFPPAAVGLIVLAALILSGVGVYLKRRQAGPIDPS
jgi:hypothetical protein